MSYIGRKPTVGNFQICDAISVVNGQAAYTMQVGSVNVLPETANHMIVSLNGTIQKPGGANPSFTVSGSTITFASNLATGDVIDFIQILGDVLDLGVPSDATVSTAKIVDANVTTAKIADANVTLAKLSATGTKDATTFLRGDNTFAAVSGGTYTIHATDEYNYYTSTGGTSAADYIDIAGGNYVSFTPTSTDDYILFNHYANVYMGNGTGANTYLIMGTSTSIGSGDTKLNYCGRQAHGGSYTGSDDWDVSAKTFLMPCTGLSVGTTYYVEQAGATASTGNWWYLNYGFTNNSGTYRIHHVGMTHYKKS